MTQSQVSFISEVVNACSQKWSDKNKCYMCDCDSNWFTNMYLDYNDNYITRDNFIENEIMPMLDWDTEVDRYRLKGAAESLIALFVNIGNCQPMLPCERIGEICIKILKGEI